MKNLPPPSLNLTARLLMALTAIVLSGCHSTSPPDLALDEEEFSPFQAPSWELEDMEGRIIKSSDFAGKVVLLDFWATWCTPCIQEIPAFVKLQDKYGKSGLQIIGVNIGEEPEQVRKIMKELGMNYPVVAGNERLETALGGVPAIPATFIIDRHGTVVEKHVGFTGPLIFEVEIKQLL